MDSGTSDCTLIGDSQSKGNKISAQNSSRCCSFGEGEIDNLYKSKVVVYAIDSSAERNIDQSSDSWSKSLIDSADSAGIASIRYKRSSIGIWYGIGTIYKIVEGVESTT